MEFQKDGRFADGPVVVESQVIILIPSTKPRSPSDPFSPTLEVSDANCVPLLMQVSMQSRKAACH